ncbi:Inositolphosphotransferase Aur1/Ipt1 domain-containing protein [Entamoeba marina]
MNKLFKHVQHFFLYLVEDFKSSIINYLTLWTVLYGFITSIVSFNIQVTWICFFYQFLLISFYFLSHFPPKFCLSVLDLFKMTHGFLLTLGLPFNFISTTEVIKMIHNSMYDGVIVTVDTFLFPHFEKGQLSLTVDQSKYLNPTTHSGMILNEYFEMLYISFYVWGYLSFFLCCLNITIEWYSERTSTDEKNNGERKKVRYIEMEYLICCWVSTCSLIFLLNVMIPGKSPRLYLKDDYTNEIVGFGFTSWWRSHIDRDDSSGTFPSGHCGETFAVALGIYYSNKPAGLLVFTMTGLIALATLWNRYHYMADLIVGIMCAWFGYFIANLHLLRVKNKG